MKCPFFGTMSGACFDHVRTIIGLALLLDEVEP